jgi:uncharacterized protein HemX
VREQIAKEIAALRTVTIADVVGMYSSIQLLEDEVDKLPLLLPYSGKALANQKDTHSNHSSDKSKEANNLLDSALSEFEGLVTIRRTDHPIKEILTPEEAQFIHEQLRVKLEMIKIALVQRNESIYQSSLADARKWVTQHFGQNSDTTNLMSELDKLVAIKIRNQFPDISLSLKMLRDITKLRIETDKGMKPAETAPQPITPAQADKIEAGDPAIPAETVPAKQ